MFGFTKKNLLWYVVGAIVLFVAVGAASGCPVFFPRYWQQRWQQQQQQHYEPFVINNDVAATGTVNGDGGWTAPITLQNEGKTMSTGHLNISSANGTFSMKYTPSDQSSKPLSLVFSAG